MKEMLIYDNKLGNDLVYWIGDDAQDNWRIIDNADGDDLWFHVYDKPSAHLILRLGGNDVKKISKATIKYCAVQCKNHSKFSSTKQKVVYTAVKNLSKGNKPGLVYTKNEKYI